MVNAMGDPIAGLCGDRELRPGDRRPLRKEFGLDKPVWQQYLNYMATSSPATSAPRSTARRSPS